VPRARARVFRHESPGMRFELAFASPHIALRSYVREYVGWFNRSSVPVLRRQLPSGFGASVVGAPGGRRRVRPHKP
jgi:hypothetical protein